MKPVKSNITVCNSDIISLSPHIKYNTHHDMTLR